MEKNLDAFRTIGEVAEELDLPQHVLRFWETKFIQIKPLKRAGGRRYYRPDDVQLVGAIRVLLYSEGYTIKGVQRILREQGARAVVAASRNNGRGLAGVRSGDETPGQPGLVPPDLASVLAPFDPDAGSSGVPLTDWAGQAEEIEGDIPASAPQFPGEANDESGARLSPQDHHRLQAVLAELSECARLLEAARRH